MSILDITIIVIGLICIPCSIYYGRKDYLKYKTKKEDKILCKYILKKIDESFIYVPKEAYLYNNAIDLEGRFGFINWESAKSVLIDIKITNPVVINNGVKLEINWYIKIDEWFENKMEELDEHMKLFAKSNYSNYIKMKQVDYWNSKFFLQEFDSYDRYGKEYVQ